MKTLSTICAASLAALLTVSCSGPKGWSVSGKVDGLAEGQKMILEANNGNSWYLVDSIAPAADGSFSYKSPVPAAHGEIMRLSIPGGSIFFPVDSVDAITLIADAASFGTAHKLGGTSLAERFSAIDSLVANTSDLDELQKKLAGFVTTDTTGTVAYYAVSKSKGSRPVFNPKDAAGNRIYGAAAQVYATYRPLDPRGELLKKAFFEGRVALGKFTPAQTVIEAPEAGLIDIERYDNKGTSRKLSDIAGKGPVLLSFTTYEDANSPAYNAILYDLYKKYRANGLEIYQLAFDSNEVSWKEAARNLPWITVWNAPTDGAGIVMQYNIDSLPLTYVIDRQGDLVERVTDPNKIEKALSKHL